MCYNMPRMKSVGEIRAAFQIGLASARANLVPMVALWALAVVLVSAYCLLPGFARALEPLREWQVRSGWIGRGFSFRRTHAEWPRHFYRELVAPNLVSNWCVWFPVQFTVFMFPLDLQIHMNGLVCAFWTLMCLQIGRRTK